jgi:cell division protein FtsQ
MDRSLAGRAAIARPWIGRWSGSGSRSGSRALSRAFEALAGLARGCWAFVADRRRLRIVLLSVLVALPLLSGGWLLLRRSSFVSVERVKVSGVHGPEAASIESALTRAARHMSTLDVQPAALTAAVAPYRIVREVHATASFPHGLHIRVIEQLPVAALMLAGGRTAVAADGVILGPALLSGSLPTMNAESDRASIGRQPGQTVRGASLLSSLAVLGAAPPRMGKQVARVFSGPEGVTVTMRNNLIVYFGDGTRPHAKWLSLARVLADPSSAGASYVDVRLPERPAAGFPGGVPRAGSASESEPASASDPGTAAELAAGLTSALGGGASPASPSTTAPAVGASPAESSTQSTGEAASTPSETSSAAPAETATAPTSEGPSTTATPGGG